MLLRGKYNTALVMTDFVESMAVGQIIAICSQEMFKDSQIRVMPDCHAGKGCVVGFTAKVQNKMAPNLVGADISCSVSAHKLDAKTIDCEKLDQVIRQFVPSGMAFRKEISKMVDRKMETKIKAVCKEIGDTGELGRHLCSMGSLGGGNHFIEVARDGDDFWLLIHCGSRNFGQKICHYHQNVADDLYNAKLNGLRSEASQHSAAQQAALLQSLDGLKLAPDFRYLEGTALDNYIDHMLIAQEFATLNHHIIAHEICSRLGWKVTDIIFTNHNYLEFLGGREMVVRKGAVSAKKDELLVIPLNMRDGTLICRGKGNAEWNHSAPHGAGRALARSVAKRELSLEEFKEAMQNVWSSSVCRGTLDESPMAYKDMNLIIGGIGGTVEVLRRIMPVYNYKAV